MVLINYLFRISFLFKQAVYFNFFLLKNPPNSNNCYKLIKKSLKIICIKGTTFK